MYKLLHINMIQTSQRNEYMKALASNRFFCAYICNALKFFMNVRALCRGWSTHTWLKEIRHNGENIFLWINTRNCQNFILNHTFKKIVCWFIVENIWTTVIASNRFFCAYICNALKFSMNVIALCSCFVKLIVALKLPLMLKLKNLKLFQNLYLMNT